MRRDLGLSFFQGHVLVSLECSKRDPTYAAGLSTGSVRVLQLGCVIVSGTPMLSADEHLVAVEIVTESHQQVAHVDRRGDFLGTGCSGQITCEH